ncbi:hypothetical protein [Actinoplanes derwentensis]|uniref:hypothetical protein n=1 Tax=Actinoplanes derwentensis TaxID=113562 RepID=UPI001A3A13BD|nr:hypothetical protein [Actinoplanes derwentensis]GID85276.1 hypothetical protein Ade03nite_42000 [Actinoplanes derwentensis]
MLHLRSRYAPEALAAVATGVVGCWALWSFFSDARTVGVQMVVMTVLILVAALTATLSGPDDELDNTGALPWRPRRAAHLLTALLVVTAPLLVTLATGARFGPAVLVIRDAAGLLGLTALSATVLGSARAWFLPLGWTLVAVLFPQPETNLGRVLTWQLQAPDDVAAAGTAVALALGGLVTYTQFGSARRTPAEAAQH